MAIIDAKASLVMGTNMKLHIADKGGTDISITQGAGTGTIDSSTTDFTASSELAGLVNRAIVIGDVITLSHTTEAGNEGKSVEVTGVTQFSITYDDIDTLTSEVAGSDINIIATKKTYEFLEAGGLSFVDGVDSIQFVSKMVDLWDAGDYDIYDPAFTSIEPRAKSMASINGWEPHNNDTLKSFRNMALEIRPSQTAAALKKYACVRSDALDETTDQFYFWYEADAQASAVTNAVTTGYINELVLIYDDNNGVPIDNTGDWLIRCAEPNKTIAMQRLDLTYAEIVAVTVSNQPDPKLVATDGTIGAGGIYTNIDYTDNTLVDAFLVDGVSYDFDAFIEADSQTNQTVHEKINYLWRQNSDINQGDGGVLYGHKQWPVTSFLGEDFTVVGFLQNYNSAQRNNLTVTDDTGTERFWPAKYTITIDCPTLASGGTFSVIYKDTYGTSLADYLEDEGLVELKDQTLSDAGVPLSLVGITLGTVFILTYNKPGFIEPGNTEFVMDGDKTVTIAPIADPSYVI